MVKKTKTEGIGGKKAETNPKEKKTAQGASIHTHWTSKNDKRNKKHYRGQGK